MDSVERFLPQVWQSVTSNAVVMSLLVAVVAMSATATGVCFIKTLRSRGVLSAIGRTAADSLLDALLIVVLTLALGTSVTQLPITLPGHDTTWLFLPAPAIYYLTAISAHVLLSLSGCVGLVYVWAMRQLQLEIDGEIPPAAGLIASLRARVTPTPGRVGLAALAGMLIATGAEATGWPIYLTIGVEALTLLGVAYAMRSLLIIVVQRLFRHAHFDNTIRKRRLERVAIVVSYLILSLGSFAIIFYHHVDLYFVNFVGIFVGLTVLDDVAAYLRGIRLPLKSPPRELSPNRWYFTCPVVLLIMFVGATGSFNAILVNGTLDARVWLEAGGAAFAFMLFAPLTDSARYSAGVRDLRERHVAPAVTRGAAAQNADSGEGASKGAEDQIGELFDSILQSPIPASTESSRAVMSLQDLSETPLPKRLNFPSHAFFLVTGLLYHAFMSNPTITNLLVSSFVPVVFVVTAAVTGVVPLLNNPRLEGVRQVFIFLVFVILVIAGITLLFTTALTPSQLRSLVQAHDVGQFFSGQSLSAILYNTSLQTLVLLTLGQLAYLFKLINTVIAVEQEQKSASDLTDLGLAFVEAGDYEDAGRLYKRAYDADPASFDAWWGLGGLFHQCATYSKALSAYERALALASDDGYRATVWRDMAETYQQQGQYQKALKACEDSWDLAPGWWWPLITAGQVHTAMGNFDQAESDYSSADYYRLYFSEGQAGDLESIRTSMSDLYRVMGQYEKAILECQNALSARPSSPWPWNSLGWVYVSQGEYDTALATFELGLKKCSSDLEKSQFNYAMGEVHLSQGSLDKALDKALEYYRLAFEQNPYDVNTLDQIATVYRRQGDFEAALSLYRDVVKKFPDDPWARIGLIACLRKPENTLENTEEKQQWIAEARRVIHTEDEYTQACLESVCGETDKAFELLRVALKKKQRQPVDVRIDDDLSFIRGDPRFEQILAEYPVPEHAVTT
jgi:tetratricopeptide (TPR) repeat protein